MPVCLLARYWHSTDVVTFRSRAGGRPCLFQHHASTDGKLLAKLPFAAAPVVGRGYASTIPVPRQYLWKTSSVTFRSRAGGKQCSCQYRVSTDGKLQAKLPFGAAPVVGHGYASTIPVPRQCRWRTSIQVTFRSRVGSRPWLCQHYASTAPVPMENFQPSYLSEPRQ